MDNMVTISNVKSNVLEFNADIEGVDTSDMSVQFIINANGMNLGFDAKHLSGSTWEVSIPPLSMLEKTAYPFKMDVTSDGYYFEPLQGTVNVVGSHDIYVSTPSNQKLEPAKRAEVSILPPSTVEEKTTPLFKKITNMGTKHVLESKKSKPIKLSTKNNKAPTKVEPLVEKAISLTPMKKSKSKTNDDIVKRILTKAQNAEQVSEVLKESTVLKVGANKIKKLIEKKATKPKVIIEAKKTQAQLDVDKALKDVLKHDNKQEQITEDVQPIPKVNKLKKLN